MKNMEGYISGISKKAKEASLAMKFLSTEAKNRALKAMAKELISRTAYILKANAKDVSSAKKEGLSSAFIDRLTLDEKRVKAIAMSLEKLASLKDPAGTVITSWRRPNGLLIKKIRVPIGVILVIYESRPNVTADCIGICIKSGNACILRGGKEAINSNIAIYEAINSAALKSGLPRNSINLIETIDRKAVGILLKKSDYIDLVIPRGGESLIREIAANSRIPVLKHAKGLCHMYVDKNSDIDLAVKLALNAKTQRPGVCNAIETLLVHAGIAGKFLPLMISEFRKKGVEVRGCSKTRAIVKGIGAATDKDWHTEYLALVISVKVVGSLDEAIAHIVKYSSGLSEAIVTKDKNARDRFLSRIDSACVYHNASTRFTDGGEFGFGAEIGISTDRLHARGPVGLEELTTYKYAIYGNGQVRA